MSSGRIRDCMPCIMQGESDSDCQRAIRELSVSDRPATSCAFQTRMHWVSCRGWRRDRLCQSLGRRGREGLPSPQRVRSGCVPPHWCTHTPEPQPTEPTSWIVTNIKIDVVSHSTVLLILRLSHMYPKYIPSFIIIFIQPSPHHFIPQGTSLWL